MGLLSTGTPLSWKETKEWAEYIRTHGIIQFINIYNSVQNRRNDLLKWGDEIEYCLVYFDHEAKTAKCDLRASEVLQIVQENERSGALHIDSLWRMEFASYMIEGTPGRPFCCSLSRLKLIETSMWLRKKQLELALSQIDPNLSVITYSAFPRIGTPNFTHPSIPIDLSKNVISRSIYIPDEAIFPDPPRFINLTRNIRSRLGAKQKIFVPVWFDKNTPKPFYDHIPDIDDGEGKTALIPDHIYMDCMGFGMGCSCIQATMQAGNIMEARCLYDQLAVLSPILIALSACSPAWKGILSEWDCRWKVISIACDDRIGDELIPGSEHYIKKSRYDVIDMYIHPENHAFNDSYVRFSPKHYETLKNSGIDDLMAKHIAHLFIRDPISLFKEKIHIDDNVELDHFENLQSTNWNSCRFKPPPHGSSIGWRVEFRSLEVQFTTFENSAFVIFIILLSRVILKWPLDLILPISLLEANMDRAIIRDAVKRSLFYFRKNITNSPLTRTTTDSDSVEEMTANEIFNGKENSFVGLIPLIHKYLSTVNLDNESSTCIKNALEFIGNRANGTLLTPASWMRRYVTSHPKYNFDSLISEEIFYDMSCLIKDIADGKKSCPLLFGHHNVNKISTANIEAYMKMIQLDSSGHDQHSTGNILTAKNILCCNDDMTIPIDC